MKSKYGSKKRNIVEMAEVGDWIVGTGGVDLSKSARHDKLIYAMWVDEKIPLKVGVHGPPCKPRSELKLPRCPSQVRRKGCTA